MTILRICLVSPQFLPDIGAGSTQTFHRARGLRDRGHYVCILTSFPAQSADRISRTYWRKIVIQEEMEGIEILRVWTPNLSSQSILNRVTILLFFSILSSIVLFTREYDVIVGAGAPSPMMWNIPFCLQSFLRNTPLVLTENDSVPNTLEGFMPRIRGTILWAIITHLSRLIESSVSHIITYTEEIKQLIVSRGILPEKITVIPLPLDTSLMRPISDGVLAIKKEIFQGKFTVMYSGALTPSYDFVSLLKAASELSDEEILFVIRGWGPLFSSVKKHIEEKNLSNVILLQEKLDFKKLVVLYNAVDLFVIPLQDIPIWSDVIIPTKLSDFIACGKPVVVSSGRATMRLIKKNKIGEAVPMGRSDLLAKAILHLYRNRDLLASMGNRARLFALEYCGIDKVTEKLEEVLVHIVNQRQRPHAPAFWNILSNSEKRSLS